MNGLRGFICHDKREPVILYQSPHPEDNLVLISMTSRQLEGRNVWHNPLE